jgi:hypothetical protein
MVVRDGRWVAAHFGSPTSETAVCLSTVGIADRFDRATIAIGGAPTDIGTALEVVAEGGAHIIAVRIGARDGIVRCDQADTDTCIAALLGTDVGVEITDRFAAIELVGPRAAQLLRAVALQLPDHNVIVAENGADSFELLVDRQIGPQLWSSLLDAGASVSVACVGLEALEHLAAARHVSRLHHAVP